METGLLSRWLDGTAPIEVLDHASAALARDQVRALGATLAIPAGVVDRLAVVASELAENQLAHARGGAIAARRIERDGVVGIELVAADAGPGLAHPAHALAEAGSTGRGLGSGIAGARRLSDEIDFDVRIGEGTCVRARAFAAPVGRHSEVGIFGRPIESEVSCGDDAGFLRREGELLVALADGLGHGDAAQEASRAAIDTFLARGEARAERVLAEWDRALQATRGAAVSFARMDLRSRELAHACLGNIRTQIYRGRDARRLGCHPGVAGAADQLPRRHRIETAPLEPGDLLVMFSDGIPSRVDLASQPLLLRAHPIEIAEHLVATAAASVDDALALVARER